MDVFTRDFPYDWETMVRTKGRRAEARCLITIEAGLMGGCAVAGGERGGPLPRGLRARRHGPRTGPPRGSPLGATAQRLQHRGILRQVRRIVLRTPYTTSLELRCDVLGACIPRHQLIFAPSQTTSQGSLAAVSFRPGFLPQDRMSCPRPYRTYATPPGGTVTAGSGASGLSRLTPLERRPPSCREPGRNWSSGRPAWSACASACRARGRRGWCCTACRWGGAGDGGH